MRVIGITGGIGSGKSKVLEFMRETYDAYVLQTDLVAHKLQEPGEDCYQKIVQTFGTEILRQDGRIDRKKLGDLVFSDVEKLKILNGIVHPAVKSYVKDEIARAKEKGISLFLVESALLKEDHYEEICDELWYIFAEEGTRMQRLREFRKLEEGKIKKIMTSQAAEADFRAYCDVTIDNSGEFTRTEEQIIQAMKGTNRR